MTVVLAEDLERDQERYRRILAARREIFQLTGLCKNCGCDLKSNLDSGPLMCAGSHQKQYEEFCANWINTAYQGEEDYGIE